MIKKIILLLYKQIVCRFFFYYNHRLYMRHMCCFFKIVGTQLEGTPRYIGFHVKFDDYRRIKIGENTTISDDCHLLTHDYSITNVMRAEGKLKGSDVAIVKGIIIGNNCFIGKKSLILPGTHIGNNVVVGAGSVVRGKIPNDSLILGNPAIIVGDIHKLARKWEEKLTDTDLRKDK